MGRGKSTGEPSESPRCSPSGYTIIVLKRDQARTPLVCAIPSRSQVARLLILMSSFLMRFRRVDGGTPKTSAAPPLPAINPLVISTTSEMCSLSAWASVHTLPTCDFGRDELASSREIPLNGGIRAGSSEIGTEASVRTGNTEVCPNVIPSRFIMDIKVVRFTPSRAAAPFRPPTTPSVCWRV
jgi:hypothetical protein